MGVATATQGLWHLDNSLADDSGNGRALTNVGGVPFVQDVPPGSAPAQGTYASLHAAGKYFTAPAGLNAAIAGATRWTIEGSFRCTNAATSPTVYSLYSTTAAFFFLYLSSSRNLVLQKTGAFAITSAVYALNTWYDFSVTYDGTSMKLRTGLAGGAQTLTATVTTTATIPADVAFQVGTYNGGGEWVGYLDNFRISTAERTAWPSVDTMDAPSLTVDNESQITATWTDFPAAGAVYVLKYSTTDNIATASGADFEPYGTLSSVVANLTPGTPYYFWLQAYTPRYGIGGSGAFTGYELASTSASATATTSTLAAPTALAAGTPTSSTIPLTWTDAASPAAFYDVYQSATELGTYALAEVAAQGDQAVTVCGLNASTAYWFKLKSRSTTGNTSAFTAAVTATTAAAIGIPAQPTALAATASGPRRINLTWVDGASTEAQVLYRNTANDYGTATAIATILAGVQAYQDEPLAASTAYYYWLEPYGAGGAGTVSAVATATTSSVPDIIQQAIFDEIVAQLATITTANGYRTNIGSNVIPWKVADWGLDQMPGVSVADTTTAVEDWKMRGGVAGERGGVQKANMQVEFALAVASVSSDAEADVQMGEVRKAVADIYALLAVNYRWNGYALNTSPQNHTFQIVQDEKVICGGKVTVQIEFRTLAFRADETGQ